MTDLNIGQSNRFDFFILQQVICARTSLQSGPEHEHPHPVDSPLKQW
jgi:hypothetical protein